MSCENSQKAGVQMTDNYEQVTDYTTNNGK